MIICIDTNELYKIGHEMISDYILEELSCGADDEKMQIGYIAGTTDAISAIVRYAEEKEKERKNTNE